MLKMITIAGSAMMFAIAPVAAQSTITEQERTPATRFDCARNSAAPECTQVQSPGTAGGPDNSTVSPGSGRGVEASGAGKASGVGPQGNPTDAGGSPRATSQ